MMSSSKNEVLQELQLAYNLAKKRSSELTALAIDSPEKYRNKLTIASKTYLAISTIIYTSMTVPMLPDLDDYVQTSSKTLSSSLFDVKEWNDILDKASKIRGHNNNEAINPTNNTVTISPSTANAKNSIQENVYEVTKQLNKIRSENEKDLEYLRSSMEAIKAQTVNALKSIEIQTISIENNYLVKEIQCKEEIHRLKERIQQLKYEGNSSIKLSNHHISISPDNQEMVTGASYSDMIRSLEQTIESQEKRIQSQEQEIIRLNELSTKDVRELCDREVDEAVAAASIKIRHIQDIFLDLEKTMRDGVATSNNRLHPKIPKDMIMTRIPSDSEWKLDEFYDKAVEIQDLLNVKMMESEQQLQVKQNKQLHHEIIKLVGKLSNEEAAEETELKSRLLELQQQYRQLEDQFEDSEVQSFMLAKELAYKNYLYAQLTLFQDQLATKQ